MTDAWLGWVNYIQNGKLAALLLAALLLMWGFKRRVDKPLLLYTSVMVLCCILPATAALLMKYQTGFYDYVWIWSLVPSTAVTAYGGTLFITEYWTDFKSAQWRRGVPAVMLLLAALALCAIPDGQWRERAVQNAQRQQAYGMIEQLSEMYPDGDICLWAPRKIMEYVRERDGRIKLIYGRNMWDVSLNGYSYDVYGEELRALYQWMERTDGEEGPTDNALEEGVRYARALGLNCILLPVDAEPETIRLMEELSGMDARQWEGCWLFYGRAD